MINYNSSNDNIIVQNMAMNLSKKSTYHELGKIGIIIFGCIV